MLKGKGSREKFRLKGLCEIVEDVRRVFRRYEFGDKGLLSREAMALKSQGKKIEFDSLTSL